MIVADCKQNEPEWYQVKAGVFSASGFDRLIGSKGSPSAEKTSEKYIRQLAAEHIIGTCGGGYSNYSMKWGHYWEPRARTAFAWENRVEVQQPGFIFKDEQRISGCSPDGIIDAWGEGIEIKCPEKKEIHVDYLLAGKLPTQYYVQVHGSMYVTGYKAWTFYSFYDGLPALQIKVHRDEDFISKLDAEIGKAAIRLAMVIKQLKEMN